MAATGRGVRQVRIRRRIERVGDDGEGDATVGIADEAKAAIGEFAGAVDFLPFDHFWLECQFSEELRDADRQILNVDGDGVNQRRGALLGLRRVGAELFAEQIEVEVFAIGAGRGDRRDRKSPRR